MARRLPARTKSGRFVKGGGRRRKRRRASVKSNPPAARRRSPRRARRSTKRRRTRSNPPRPRVTAKGAVGQLVQGAKDAAMVVTGKAAARALPTLLKLPKEGALGIGVQIGVGLASGFLAHWFGGRDAGRFILAGALSAPIETVLVAKRVPFFAPALSPATAATQVGAYAMPSVGGVGAYYLPDAVEADAGMSGYVAAHRTPAMSGAGDDYPYN